MKRSLSAVVVTVIAVAAVALLHQGAKPAPRIDLIANGLGGGGIGGGSVHASGRITPAPEEEAPESYELHPNTSSSTHNCFEAPLVEVEGHMQGEGTERMTACGYATPEDVGAEAPKGDDGTGKGCASLPTETSKPEPVIISTPNTTITGKLFTGYIAVQAEHVTLKDDCQIFQEAEDHGEGSGIGLELREGSSYFHLENSTIKTKNLSSWTYPECIHSEGNGNETGVLVRQDVIEGCNGNGGMIHGSAKPGFTFEIEESYVFANGNLGKEERELSFHREDGYQTNGHVKIKRSTFLDPTSEVALYFSETESHKGHNVNAIQVEESLLSGAGTEFGAGSENEDHELVKSEFIFSHNRVARCTTEPFSPSGALTSGEGQAGGCSGSWYEGSDTHGYMEHGGSASVFAVPEGETRTGWFTAGHWTGNFYDNNGETITE